jgi:spore coat polysaccharide biosynthesis predicted glycosyltransferase SpsG
MLASLCRLERPDALLLDLPCYEADVFDTLRGTGIPLICIDDWGGPIAADLVINGTVIDAYHRYPNLPAGATALTGGAYTLIRPDFGRTTWTDLDDAGIVIVVGSGQRARDWAHLLLDGDRTGWGPVTMIVGSVFPRRAAFAAAAALRGIDVRGGLDAAALAACLSQAAVTLITGGMVVYEAMAVGVPAVVFPQLDNMIVEAGFLSAAGCILDLGFDAGMSPPVIGRTIDALLADRNLRREMSRRQRAMVDGKGMERAASAISRFLAEPRP